MHQLEGSIVAILVTAKPLVKNDDAAVLDTMRPLVENDDVDIQAPLS